jgi:hypothetical protein
MATQDALDQLFKIAGGFVVSKRCNIGGNNGFTRIAGQSPIGGPVDSKRKTYG